MAKLLETEPLDAIYFGGDASLAVSEAGRLSTHVFGKTKRCLIIGVGSLDTLSIAEFRSVLAHEFGHFYHHDTFGGSIALLVRQNLNSAMQMLESDPLGQWFNPVWLYIAIFYRIFLRISQGAARLKEFMADAIAVQSYGKELFAESLEKIMKVQIRFDCISTIEFMNALNENVLPRNVFKLDIPETWPDDVTYSYGYTFMSLKPSEGINTPGELIAHNYKEIITKDTGILDSHPSFRDRIYAITKTNRHLPFTSPTTDVISTEDDLPAETLIPDLPTYQELVSNSLFTELIAEREYMTDVIYENRLRKNN